MRNSNIEYYNEKLPKVEFLYEEIYKEERRRDFNIIKMIEKPR
jgi:hypothetical protein